MEQPEIVVETRGLTRVYRLGPTEVPALRGVDLVIARQEFVSIVGRSGSGKSTLLHLLGCLDRPTTGSVWLEGIEVTALPRRRLPAVRRDKVGFVFQQFNLLPRTTALSNVELPLIYGGGKDREQRALAALDRVGLAPRAHHRPNELSGGEQQRVAIARALINEPAIILADEPTGNLDTKAGDEVIAILKQLNQEQKITIVLVTHEPDIGAQADRIVRLRDGLLAE